MSTDLEDLHAEFENYKAEFVKKGSVLLTNYFTKFMQEHPEIKLITWNQYTPGYCDGDPCYFNIYGPHFVDKNIEEIRENIEKEDSEYYGESLSTVLEEYENMLYQGKYESLKPELRKFEETLQQSADLLEFMFGDGKKIIVTNKGLEVEEYEYEY
jgi:hypothetical protein